MSDLDALQEKLKQLEAALADVKASINSATQAEDFDQIKEILFSDKWPAAANKNLICDPENENDKVERGRGVIELMVETNLEGKKFLDFGCGEGHCALYAASHKPTISVGYDIKETGWEGHKADNLLLTTEWAEVAKHAPYDAILVYDVIDHLEDKKPIEVMKQLNDVLATDGRIYLRAHPFTSRHALHNYHDLNKGYIQLVFSPEELKSLMPDAKYVDWNQGNVMTPLATYKKLFNDTSLEIVNTRPVKDTVEPFFKAPLLAKKIIKTVGFNVFPEFQMGLQFIDYVLKKQETPKI
jgi:2-polyprenyl-3-methyl-5-hydroxy-6-metoxy-1,4-benzoquinol methylase